MDLTASMMSPVTGIISVHSTVFSWIKTICRRSSESQASS